MDNQFKVYLKLADKVEKLSCDLHIFRRFTRIETNSLRTPALVLFGIMDRNRKFCIPLNHAIDQPWNGAIFDVILNPKYPIIMKFNPTLMPSLAVAGCGAIWGLYWIPIRYLDAGGIPPSWASLITFCLVGVVSFAALVIQKVKTGRLPWSIVQTGLISGACFVFYAVALIMTEVVKVVLLFYLTPVWSTILGRILLKERITPFRVIAVCMGLSGLAVILGVFSGLPTISNLGDLLALLSGLLWSYASVRIRKDSQAKVWEQISAFYIGGAIASAIFVVLPIYGLNNPPSFDAIRQSVFWMIIFVMAYLPSMYLIFWGAQRLSPARVGILLMTEIIFGVASAALLSGEPFGWTQAIGIALIFGAAVTDVSDRLAEFNAAQGHQVQD